MQVGLFSYPKVTFIPLKKRMNFPMLRNFDSTYLTTLLQATSNIAKRRFHFCIFFLTAGDVSIKMVPFLSRDEGYHGGHIHFVCRIHESAICKTHFLLYLVWIKHSTAKLAVPRNISDIKPILNFSSISNNVWDLASFSYTVIFSLLCLDISFHRKSCSPLGAN